MNYNPAPKTRRIPKNPGTGEYWSVEITQRIHNGADCYPWRQVFAWLPCRTVSGKIVWLRKIYKRKYWVVWGRSFHMEPHVDYGDLFDILENPDN